MTAKDWEVLHERLHDTYDLLYTGGVKEAHDAYGAYISGELGAAHAAPMSHHTVYHLPAVMHIISAEWGRLHYRDQSGYVEQAQAWIAWAKVLIDRYHRRAQPGDIGTAAPAWRDPMALRPWEGVPR